MPIELGQVLTGYESICHLGDEAMREALRLRLRCHKGLVQDDLSHKHPPQNRLPLWMEPKEDLVHVFHEFFSVRLPVVQVRAELAEALAPLRVGPGDQPLDYGVQRAAVKALAAVDRRLVLPQPLPVRPAFVSLVW